MAAPMKFCHSALFSPNVRLFDTILNSTNLKCYFSGLNLNLTTSISHNQRPLSSRVPFLLAYHCEQKKYNNNINNNRFLHTSITCLVKKKPIRNVHHTDTYIDLPEHSNYTGYGFEPLSGQDEVVDALTTDTEIQNDVLRKVEAEIDNEDQRLFAVVQIQGHQYKITENDLILLDTHHPTQPGDIIELNKVLLVGGNNFTKIGMPLIDRDAVHIEARVIEKSHTPPIYNFFKRRRKGWKRMKITYRDYTVLRITKVQLNNV